MRERKRPNEREQLVREALVQLFGLQLCAGAAANDLTAFASSCIAEAARNHYVRTNKEDVFDAQDYGSVLRTWHRESPYLSPTGFPRPLSTGGKYGLRRLIERYYPGDLYLPVLASLRDAGLIREQGAGKWIPSEKCAVFPRLNDELLAHLSEGVSRLVETVTQNVTARSKEDVLFERSAKVRAFPISAGLEFRKFVNDQASAFLGAVDDWLESRAATSIRSRKRKCTAGVFAFAFMDDVHAAKPKRRLASKQNLSVSRSRRSRQLIPQRSP
jgi:hypothetical protein